MSHMLKKCLISLIESREIDTAPVIIGESLGGRLAMHTALYNNIIASRMVILDVGMKVSDERDFLESMLTNLNNLCISNLKYIQGCQVKTDTFKVKNRYS